MRRPRATTPEEIDITNAAALRAAVLQAAAHGHGTFAVDMTGTRFCDWAGLSVLLGAHRRARAEGGEVVGAENLCHKAIFVDDATDTVMPPDPDVIQVGDAVWQ